MNRDSQVHGGQIEAKFLLHNMYPDFPNSNFKSLSHFLRGVPSGDLCQNLSINTISTVTHEWEQNYSVAHALILVKVSSACIPGSLPGLGIKKYLYFIPNFNHS